MRPELVPSPPRPQHRRISFVWSPHERLPAGTGGSENYTIGHVRELVRRGVAARVVTVGLGAQDGRDEFVDIPFHSLATWDDLGGLDDTVVFVSEAPAVETRHPAYQILHVPPPRRDAERRAVRTATATRTLIATSTYAAGLWATFLDVDVHTVHVVRPFAEPEFAAADRVRRRRSGRRVLYAGRLAPEKGIYTLLSMLHHELFLDEPALEVTVTTAGADKADGAVIERVVAAHPGVRLVPAQTTPFAMAQLMASHDVVVVPSNSQYWHETFGIVSIEAQHAGCRVVASDDGGLPETDCGALHLVEPDNAEALAVGLLAALRQAPVAASARASTARLFTVAQSADALLAALDAPVQVTPAAVVLHLEELAALPYVDPVGERRTPPGRADAVVGSMPVPRGSAVVVSPDAPHGQTARVRAATTVASAAHDAREARRHAASRAARLVTDDAALAAVAVRARNAVSARRFDDLAIRTRRLMLEAGSTTHPATMAELLFSMVTAVAETSATDAEGDAELVATVVEDAASRVLDLVHELDASTEQDVVRAARDLEHLSRPLAVT